MFHRKSMSCESCSAKFTILKRRKTCLDCSYDYCVDCVSRTKVFDRKYQCIRCKVFAAVPVDPNAVMQLKVKDLRWFLASKAVPIVGCKEKTELVELIMQYSSHSAAHSSYPQNFKHHTVIPELLNYKNVGYKTSPTFTSDSPSHSPGPSGAAYIPPTSRVLQDEPDIPRHNIETNEQPNVICSNTGRSEEPVNNILESENLSASTEPSIDLNFLPEEQNSDDKKDDNKTKEHQTISLDSVGSLEDISALSVMQLKVLLTRNFVAYQGCREKSELQEKVRWLWKQKQSAKSVDNVPDENLCKICMEAAIDSVLLDCGHMMTCTQCGKQLHECPICRQIIVRVVHTFKS